MTIIYIPKQPGKPTEWFKLKINKIIIIYTCIILYAKAMYKKATHRDKYKCKYIYTFFYTLLL